MKRENAGWLFIVVLGFAALISTGCTTTRMTLPARTATEQLLLSSALDRSLQFASLSIFTNRKVYVDGTYFDSYDSKYAVGAIRDALSRNGALLVDNLTNCEIVIEIRSGALAIDSSEKLFGIPNVGLPIPLTGVVTIPELAFYKSEKQNSISKLALLAFGRESRAHIYSSGPLDGKAYYHQFRLLFASWIRTDVPEKQKNQRAADLFQVNSVQYDLKNMPATNQFNANLRSTNSIVTNAPSISPKVVPP